MLPLAHYFHMILQVRDFAYVIRGYHGFLFDGLDFSKKTK
jgi:hypothetical protein